MLEDCTVTQEGGQECSIYMEIGVSQAVKAKYVVLPVGILSPETLTRPSIFACEKCTFDSFPAKFRQFLALCKRFQSRLSLCHSKLLSNGNPWVYAGCHLPNRKYGYCILTSLIEEAMRLFPEHVKVQVNALD